MKNTSQQILNFNFLNFIEPPLTFPPTQTDIIRQIQQKFYNQCMNFLKAEKKLYTYSKTIEERLSSTINDSTSLNQQIKLRAPKLQKVTKQLKKINHNFRQTEQKQEFLGSLCKFINMQSARNVLLQTKITNEEQFINKLKQIDNYSEQIKSLNSDIKVIVQVKEQLISLLQQTVNKVIKGNVSDSLLRRITSDVSQPFLRDQKVAMPFILSLISQRHNFFKVGLNPLVNNINYVQNVTQLYQKIIQEWIRMLDQDLKTFHRQEVPEELKGIPKQVMIRFIPQILPKMQRGIYKVKDIVDISKIQFHLKKLKAKVEECGQHTNDMIAKVILKIKIILEERLEQGAEEIEIAKYNIYSLVSYVPIRQHLQLIKQAKSYDPNNKQTNWQRGFKRLSQSRDPSKQPNNKSLIIFNLNIWFLYSNVMRQQGQLKQKAESMIKQCINIIANLNLLALKKQYQSKSLQKVFDLCADYQAVLKNVHAEIYLLHHEKLRLAVEKQLNKRFIDQIYQPLLKHHKLEAGLTNHQTIQLAKKEKINLNKYGKMSESIKILPVDQLRQMLS